MTHSLCETITKTLRRHLNRADYHANNMVAVGDTGAMPRYDGATWRQEASSAAVLAIRTGTATE